MLEVNTLSQYEETKDEIQKKKKIRNLATKTLLNFLASEVIDFGFGVPLGTILAIIYGNIAEIFMEIYFMPIAVLTVFTLIFVAYPTNLYLTRQLIKTIFDPKIENAQKFLLVSGKTSLYASIHLLIRISIGGLIVDAWGTVRQGEFILDRFITVGISPILGAFVAGIVFYFVSQKIFSKFNIEIIKMSSISEFKTVEESKRVKPLSSSKVFSALISFTILLVSVILSIGYLFGATFVGMLIIVGVGTVTVALLLYFYVSLISEIVNNLREATKVIGKKKGKIIVPMIYDIDNIIVLVKEYLEKIENEYGELLEKIFKVGDMRKFEIFNSALEMKLKRIINDLRKLKIHENLATELKKTLGLIGSDIRTAYSKFIELETSTNLLLQELGKSEELKNLKEIETYFDRTLKILADTRETIENIKESAFSIVPKVEEFEKVKNDIEVVFINFQLEMARIGYPLEFKVISNKLGKELERIENVSYNIRDQASEISKNSEVIVGELREMIVILEMTQSMFEEINKILSAVSKVDLKKIMEELRNKVEDATSSFRNIREKLSKVDKLILEHTQTINTLFQKIQELSTNISNIVEEITNSLAILSENPKNIQSLNEGIETFKKINEQN